MPRKPKARPKTPPAPAKPAEASPEPLIGGTVIPANAGYDPDNTRMAALVDHIDPLEIVKALAAAKWTVADEIKLLVGIARDSKSERSKMEALAAISRRVKETLQLAGIIHHVTERYQHTSASGDTSTSLDVTRTGVKSSLIRNAARDTQEFLAALGTQDTETPKDVPNVDTTKGKPDDKASPAPEPEPEREPGLPSIDFTGKRGASGDERDERGDDVRAGATDIESEGSGDSPGTSPGDAPQPPRHAPDSTPGRQRPTKDTLGGGICTPDDRDPFTNQQQGAPTDTPH